MASFVPKGVFRIFKRRGWTNWGKNQNPQKFPEPKINPQKILYRTTHRQNYSVKIKPTKKILATFFLPQKNPGIENFKPKKSFYHRRHLKSGLPQLEFRSTPNFLIKSLLMAYFITAKQIVEYEAESERPTSKKERTKNGKNKQVPCIFLETEIHSTRKRRTLNAGERVCNKPNGSVNLKRDHPLWVFALPRRTRTHCWVFGIKCFGSGRGEYSRGLHF